jgi:hypothetical protein
MKEIILPTGHIAIVDDDDYERVSAHKWAVLDNHGRGFYARANLKVSSTPRKYESLLMHRFISGAVRGQVADHINRNGLDNRKENLRVATRSTNAANSKHRADRSTSPYRGVYKIGKITKKYEAQLRADGVLHRLGRYLDPKEAALAYDYAAGHYFGEFAVKNNAQGESYEPW